MNPHSLVRPTDLCRIKEVFKAAGYVVDRTPRQNAKNPSLSGSNRSRYAGIKDGCLSREVVRHVVDTK